MGKIFKIFLLVALSFLSSFTVSANHTLFSIEKSSDRIEELANAVDDIIYRSDFIEHLTDVKGFTQKRDGQTLQGQMFLEIPASNQSLSNIQDYINLANSKNITLRFKIE